MMEVIMVAMPSIISGIMLWWIKKYVDRKEREDERLEQSRVEYTLFVLKGITASLSLGEATANFIEREVSSQELADARIYATEIKREIKNFMFKQSAENLK